jgi:type I restriction enzyme S subunit
VNKGTVILRLTDLQNDQRSLRVGLASERGIITSAYLGLVFNRSINPKFAYYLLHAYDLAKVFYWFGGGLRSTMRFDDIKVIPFVIPPVSEQEAIAKYLDEKTVKIDCIVTAINDQLDKLKDLRKALINDVVTGKIKITSEGLAT